MAVVRDVGVLVSFLLNRITNKTSQSTEQPGKSGSQSYDFSNIIGQNVLCLTLSRQAQSRSADAGCNGTCKHTSPHRDAYGLSQITDSIHHRCKISYFTG